MRREIKAARCHLKGDILYGQFVSGDGQQKYDTFSGRFLNHFELASSCANRRPPLKCFTCIIRTHCNDIDTSDIFGGDVTEFVLGLQPILCARDNF